MSSYRASSTAAAVLALLVGTASSASAYPASVSDTHTIGTVYGTCVVDVSARAEPGLAVIGQLTGTESVNCGSLSITPYRIYLSGAFGGTSADPLNVTHSGEPNRTCERQDACYWSRSRSWFPPGDYSVTHEVDIDIAPYAVAETYLSVPSGCRVATSDRGYLACHFTQRVTMPTPSP
jgi:hypothetical protein